MKERLLDISPRLTPAIAVWPGDVPFARDVALAMDKGHNLTLSSLTTTVHVGAHADAPSHYRQDGAAIDAVDLEDYVGPCLVISCLDAPGGLIQPEHCAPALAARVPRVLFRTLSQPDPEIFNEDFTAFSPAAISLLGDSGVRLVGIDTPSVDPFASKTLDAHQQLARYGMRNLEGLVLKDVADGLYELIALPLRLVDFDASPVRAVLRTMAPTTEKT